MAGAITLATVNFEGTGYAVGDTGTINGGDGNATYVVDTESGGAVLTFTLTFGGSGYVVADEQATSRGGGQPGSGSGFIVDINTVSGGGSPYKNHFYSTPA